MSKESQISEEVRFEAVLQVLKREEPMNVLSRRYGVSEQTLYRWRDQFLEAGRAALKSPRGKDGREEEIRRLKRELWESQRTVGELTIANNILKKTLPPPR
jgi:transposase-like protein